MKQTLFIYSILCLIIAVPSVPAQQTGGNDSLITLHGLIEYARTRSLQMKSAELSLSASNLDLISARNSLYPTARAGLSAGRQLIPDRQLSTGASIGADLELSPSKYLSYKAEKQNNSAAEQTFRQQEWDLTFQVISRYIRVVEALKLIGIEQKNVDYQNLKLREISAQLEQGAVSRADLLQQKANCAEAQVRLLQKMQEYQRLQLELVDGAGLPLSMRYQLDTAEVMLVVRTLNGDTSENSFERVAEKEEVTAQRFRLKADEALVRSSLLGYVPSLSFSGSYGVDGSVDDLSPSLRVGASLSIPLVDRRQRWLQVKNAQLRLQSAGVELDKLLRNADRSLLEAALDDLLAADRVTAGERRNDAAQEALLAMEERYRVGASTLAELKVVQSAGLEAAGSLVEARFDRTVSRLTVLYETGRMDRVLDLLPNEMKKEN